MIYTQDQLKELKIRLALEGSGAKGKMAKRIKCAKCQLSILLTTGFIPNKFKAKVDKYL